MCLRPKHKKVKVASRRITVYKVLVERQNGCLLSPYKSAPYQLNRELAVSPLAWRASKTAARGKRQSIDNGLHVLRTPHVRTWGTMALGSHYFGTNKLFKAVIPKGAQYFIGDSNDIVSNKLIVLAEV